MRFKKLMMSVAFIVTTLSFTGCAPVPYVPVVPGGGYYDHGAYYNSGYSDGCKTSRRGHIVRNSYKWNNYSSYRNGWYAGKRQCRRSHASGRYYNSGYSDGCKTSRRGYIVRNSYKWNNYSSYKNGWYAGKRQCRRNHTSRRYYSRGYSDGCWSRRHRGIRKNTRLFNRNRGNYATGWRNGYRNCRR